MCMQEMALVTVKVDGTAIGSVRGFSRRGGSRNGIECIRKSFGIPECIEYRIRCCLLKLVRQEVGGHLLSHGCGDAWSSSTWTDTPKYNRK